MWKKRAKSFVSSKFGEDYLAILRKTLFFGQMIMSQAHGQQMHVEAMSKAIEFLEGLKNEPMLIEISTEPQSQTSGSIFQLSELHPLINEKCKSLFDNKEYSEAVEKSFKIVRDKLRELTGFETGSEAFGKGKIHIKGAAAPYVDGDFNAGVKFLSMAIDRFRNEKSHVVDGNIDNPKRAYEYLVLSSLAMNLLDNSEILQ